MLLLCVGRVQHVVSCTYVWYVALSSSPLCFCLFIQFFLCRQVWSLDSLSMKEREAGERVKERVNIVDDFHFKYCSTYMVVKHTLDVKLCKE